MLKFVCCVIFSLCLSSANCEGHSPKIIKASKEEYNMEITEQGWRYTEKISFDISKKFVVHDVPAHRNITQSNVMVDFASNTTVTRLASRRVCYIRPTSHEEPSLDNLKKSMDMVSSGQYKMNKDFKVITTSWRLKGLAELSKLSDKIIDFCRGMHIYEVEEYAKDGAKVVKPISRSKRSTSTKKGALYVLCDPWTVVNQRLRRCDRSQWILKCQFPTENCFHYVTCTHGRIDFTDGICTSTHRFDDFTCCSPYCP